MTEIPALHSPDTGLVGFERVKAMTAVALAVLLSVLDYAVANVALPSIAADLKIPASQSIWVTNAYQLASLSMLLPLASIGGRIGYAAMCRIGIFVFLVASVLCALSHSLLFLALARALQGVGGASIMGVAVALVRFIYPRNALGKGLAAYGLIVGVGVALGPTVGSIVMSVARWPWIFWINLPFGFCALMLSIFALPDTPRSERKLDVISIVLTIASFTLTVIGIDNVVHDALGLGVIFFTVGLACWACLLRYQKNSSEPVIPIDLLRLPSFSSAFSVAVIGFIASNLFIVAMPFTLQLVFHRPPTVTGFLITPWASGVAVMSVLVGRWVDRVPGALLTSLGLFITGLGFVLLWCLPASASNWDFAWRIGFAGLGFGMFQPPNNKLLMLASPHGREGSASGMIAVSRLGGQTLGGLLVASIFRFSGQLTTSCLFYAVIAAWLGSLLSLSRLVYGARRRPT